MEKRGSTSTSDIRELIKYAAEQDGALVINCDRVKKGAVVVVATGPYALRLKRVLDEADVLAREEEA